MCLVVDVTKKQEDYYKDYTEVEIDGIKYLLAIKVFFILMQM